MVGSAQACNPARAWLLLQAVLSAGSRAWRYGPVRAWRYGLALAACSPADWAAWPEHRLAGRAQACALPARCSAALVGHHPRWQFLLPQLWAAIGLALVGVIRVAWALPECWPMLASPEQR